MFQRILIVSLLFVWIQVHGQIVHPKTSPFSRVQQEIGLSAITIKYSRPAARGRKIFGGLVPYGRIWRVGANESTKITVDTDMEVMGNVLPKGTYALYAFPNAKEWQIVFHSNITHWGDGRKNYDPSEDVFRVRVKPEEIGCYQENFLIAFDSITHNSAQMELVWANTKIVVPFTVDTHGQMKIEIAKNIASNPTAQTYYEAARYLQEQGIEYDQALSYVKKAQKLGGDTYYFHRVKSLIEVALGDYASAMRSAQKSLEISRSLEKDEFVRMNEANIKKWKNFIE